MACSAVIDIGTHSALLLVAETAGGSLRPLLDEARTTRLGAGLKDSQRISPEAQARLLQVLATYEAILSEYEIERLLCFGTAVFRHARNAAEVLQQIQLKLGWPVQVLSGQQEAEYTFKGVLQTQLADPAGGSAIAVDIGGGSTEVIFGSRRAIAQCWSFPVGALSLQEQFQLGESIDSQTAAAIDRFLEDCFGPLLPPEPAAPMIVTGGTATTLAALMLELQSYDISRIDGCQFSQAQLAVMYSELNQLTVSQRADLPGMEAGRAEVILPAMRILQGLLHRLQAQAITVTVRGARYGLLEAAL